MNRIIDRCPFFDTETVAATCSGPVVIRAYQIVLWIGIQVLGKLSRPFPTVLDTGHSYAF